MKKWKNNQGTSYLAALLLFLLCSGCCCALLAAVTGMSGWASGLGAEKQEQLLLASGARLLRDALEENTCRGYLESGETGSEDALVITREPGGDLGDILEKGVRQVKETGFPCRLNWTMEVAGREEQPVQAEFTMDRKYEVTVILKGERQQCGLRIPAVSGQETEDPDGKRPFFVTWSRGTILPGKESVQ